MPGLDLVIVPEFLAEADRRDLLAWALSMGPELRQNLISESRNFRRVHQLSGRPVVYDRLRERIETVLALGSAPVREPEIDAYLSVIAEGGAVHRHIDSAPPGTRHLRCNVFLQLPEAGGAPRIEGMSQPVTEGSLLAFFPSEKYHSSLPVEGRTPRVMLSFGYLTPADYALQSPAMAAAI